MSKAKYYFLHDTDMQWFSALVELEGEPDEECRYKYEQITKLTDVPREIQGEFLSNIWAREPHFWRREINRTGYVGWALSKDEYDKIREIIELFPSYQKYLKLLHK